MRLYEFSTGFVFAVVDEPFWDAWGNLRVQGALFNTNDGTVQAGAYVTANIPMPERDIVLGGAPPAFGRIVDLVTI